MTSKLEAQMHFSFLWLKGGGKAWRWAGNFS